MEKILKSLLINSTAPFGCLDIYEVDKLTDPSFVIQQRFNPDKNVEEQSVKFIKEFEANYINFFNDKYDSEIHYITKPKIIDGSFISRVLNKSITGNKIIWYCEKNLRTSYYWCKSVFCEDRIIVFSNFKQKAEYCISFNNKNGSVDVALSVDLSKSKTGRLDQIILT